MKLIVLNRKGLYLHCHLILTTHSTSYLQDESQLQKLYQSMAGRQATPAPAHPCANCTVYTHPPNTLASCHAHTSHSLATSSSDVMPSLYNTPSPHASPSPHGTPSSHDIPSSYFTHPSYVTCTLTFSDVCPYLTPHPHITST